ncbi:TPA: hypothetical protein ACHHNY_004379 [Escherichia coli]
MAANNTKIKALHYRHAVMLPKKDALLTSDLQSRLSEIVTHKFRTVQDRVHFLETKDSDPDVATHAHMVMSNSFERNGMFFAEIVYIEPGGSIPVFDVTEYKNPKLEYEAFRIAGGDVKEYLDSFAYIGVVKNHVVILQSRAIRIKDIENYINFILKENLRVDVENFIVLQVNNLSISNEFLRRNNIKNVSLKLPLTYNGNGVDDAASELLRSLIGEHRVEELRKNSTPDTEIKEHLTIDISIGYKYRASDNEQDLLRKITEGLIDNRDEMLTIELKGAGILKNDEIQIKDNVSIEYSKGLPVVDSVCDEMVEWLLRLLDAGVINP